MSIQAFFLITALLIMPLFTAGYIFNLKLSDGLHTMEKERLLISSQATHALLDKLGENLLGTVKTNAFWEDNWMAVKNKDITWIEENINNVIEAVPNLHFIATSDLEGKIISQTGDMKEFTGTIAYPNLVQRVQSNSNFYGLVKTTKGLTMIAASNISNDEGNAEPAGILIFGTILDEATLADIKTTLASDISLLTVDGSLLTTSKEVSKNQLQPFLEKVAANQKAEIFEYQESGQLHSAHVVSSVQGVMGEHLGIMDVSQKLPASSEMKKDVKEVTVFVSFVIIFITILIYVFLKQKIIKPIQHLASVLNEIAKGDLTRFIMEKYLKREDEIGDLASATRKMKSDLHDLIELILANSQKVAESADELCSSTEETTRITHQITSAMSEVASGAEIQLQGVEESSKAMNDMAKGILFIAEAASAVSDTSIQTEKEALLGNESIQKVIRQMDNIGESVNQSAFLVQTLNERSKEIDQIIGLIRGIADQTNLLALNASIEAARAGEHGRGFAVVAEEVKKLAEQAKASTQRVADLTITVQSDALSSVTSMNRVDREVQEGIEAVRQAGEVFNRILRATEEVSRQVQDVSASSQELSASTEELGATMDNMAEIAKKSTIGVQTVAASSQEQLASIQMVASSTELLNSISKELQDLIHKFKV